MYATALSISDNTKVFFAFANPGGSFFYVLTGLHAFHLISGIIYLLFTLYSGLNNKISSKGEKVNLFNSNLNLHIAPPEK